MLKKKIILRLISFIMLIAAVIFIFCALSAPTLGTAVYIGSFYFGAAQWRICYLIYIILMISLFITSFFLKDK